MNEYVCEYVYVETIQILAKNKKEALEKIDIGDFETLDFIYGYPKKSTLKLERSD